MNRLLLLLIFASTTFCTPTKKLPEIQQWTVYEIDLSADQVYENPYTDVDVWAIFVNTKGDSLIRPGFWDGGDSWKIRFAPPTANDRWTWTTFSSFKNEKGLSGKKGAFNSISYNGDNELLKHGLLGISPGKRNVVHKDGTPFLVVGDTPWALPFRATTDQVRIYAKDRQAKGFNAALLMTVQPDTKAKGPEERDTPQGFMRGFVDLDEGHINQLKPTYYQYLDSLTGILLAHEIVPVYQPVFHGYGWKGKQVLGTNVDPGEYVRYCKYLLARYGSQPAFWLPAGDHDGKDPGVKESGEMWEEWDIYQQPTGLHYNPCDDYVADWAVNNPAKHCNHYNKSYQAEPWLDFQWAQSGHSNEHLYHKVERMYDNLPTKANANGEPTYEGMNGGKNGLGWWQGEEAWMQLMSGGTMGVVYGAATLWQWKVAPDEAGWPVWTDQPMSWREALEMEGSNYAGFVAKVFEGYDFADMEKRPDLTGGKQPLLAKEGVFYISYLNEGGTISISGVPNGLPYRWINPKSMEFLKEQNVEGETFESPGDGPWVLVVGEKKKN